MTAGRGPLGRRAGLWSFAVLLAAVLAAPSQAAVPLPGKWKGTWSAEDIGPIPTQATGNLKFTVRGNQGKIDDGLTIEGLGPPFCFDPPPSFVGPLPANTSGFYFNEIYVIQGGQLLPEPLFGIVKDPGADFEALHASADAVIQFSGKFQSKKKASGEYFVNSEPFVQENTYTDCYVTNGGNWKARRR